MVYNEFSIIPSDRKKRCFQQVPESLINQAMARLANMTINGMSIPACIEAKDTIPKAMVRPKEIALQWPKVLMTHAIYAQGAELGLVEACQWVNPTEIDQQLQTARQDLTAELKNMLRRNPAGKVELETIPTAVITATLADMRLSNNDEINIISDSESESEEEPIVGNISSEWMPEVSRAGEQGLYNIQPQIIRPTLIPNRFQAQPRKRTSAPSTPANRNTPSPDWESFMDSIRNLVTTEVERAQNSQQSTPQSRSMSPLVTHSRSAPRPMVNINITPTKSSTKRRKYLENYTVLKRFNRTSGLDLKENQPSPKRPRTRGRTIMNKSLNKTRRPSPAGPRRKGHCQKPGKLMRPKSDRTKAWKQA